MAPRLGGNRADPLAHDGVVARHYHSHADDQLSAAGGIHFYIGSLLEPMALPASYSLGWVRGRGELSSASTGGKGEPPRVSSRWRWSSQAAASRIRLPPAADVCPVSTSAQRTLCPTSPRTGAGTCHSWAVLSRLPVRRVRPSG